MIDPSIEHLFPTINDPINKYAYTISVSEYLDGFVVSYSLRDTFLSKEVGLGVKTRDFCEGLCMTDEDTLIWVLKFGEYLPRVFYKHGDPINFLIHFK